MKSGFHPAPFLCLSDSVCAWPGGTFNLINIYLVGTKGFVGLPKDYFLFSFFFFFPLIKKIRKKILLLLFSAAQKCWDARESGNMPTGVFLPSRLCRVFLHMLFPESWGFVLGSLGYLEAETALTADPYADARGAAPQPCHSPWGGVQGRGLL